MQRALHRERVMHTEAERRSVDRRQLGDRSACPLVVHVVPCSCCPSRSHVLSAHVSVSLVL